MTNASPAGHTADTITDEEPFTSTIKGTRPTMHDVAAGAGVSLKTVSRVVNGDPAVAPATAAKVREVIGAIEYRRNDAARMLRPGQRSQLLGLVIADLHNPFYATVAAHIEELVRPKGFDLMTANTREDPELEFRAVETFRSRQCDGLIVVPTHGSKLPKDRAPIVYLDRVPDSGDMPSVVLDNANGARQAVDHLASRGHSRIAFVGDAPTRIATAEERFRGYRSALAALRLGPVPPLEVLGTHTVDEAAEATEELLTRHPDIDAIFATNNRNTLGALTAMKRLDHRVSIIGFDDFESAELLGVSVVAYSFAELARATVDLLLSHISGSAETADLRVVATKLIERGSSSWTRQPKMR